MEEANTHDGTGASFARVFARGAVCKFASLEATVYRKNAGRRSLRRSLFFFLTLSFFPSHFPRALASAEGHPRSNETQRVHRNRRGPRVTNASKMDKGYTWPPDGRRRHALLLLSLYASSHSFFLALSLSSSLFSLPTNKSRFYPSVHTCPSPTRMHVVTAVRVARVVNAHGLLPTMPVVRRMWRETGSHCRNRNVEHPKLSFRR